MRFLFFAPILLAGPHLAEAQVQWNGSTSGNWGTAANWSGHAVPESGDLLVFPASGSTKAMVNNLPSGTQYQSLEFQAPGYSLTGGKMILLVPGTGFPSIQAGHSTGTTTFNCAFDQTDTVATFRALAGATLAFGPNASGNLGSGTLSIESFGTIVVGGNWAGTGEILIKFGGVTRYETALSHSGMTRVAGASTLFLNATISGPLTVTGTLRGNGGTLSSLTMNGDIDPGENGPGRLTVGGSLQFSTTATTATTNGTRVTLRATKAIPTGSDFILIDKTSTGPISLDEPFITPDGTPITEGFEVTDGPNRFRFSYAGGDGNDFTATVVPIPPRIFTPLLTNAIVTPAGLPGSGIFATLSGHFSGGPSGGNLIVETSIDLSTWRILAARPLDADGNAVLSALPDPASEGADSLYFRTRLP
jgi:hypothetical protein